MKNKVGRPELDKKDRRKTLCVRLPPVKMAALKMATQETNTKAIEMAIDFYLHYNVKLGS